MDENALFNLLKERYGKVSRASGGWFQIPCPTCSPKNARKMRRYVSYKNLYTKCWICETSITREQLLGQALIDYKPSALVQNIEKTINPWANKLPYRKSIAVNKLPAEHPAVKFFNKDHLMDMNKLAIDHDIVYVPSDGGVIFRDRKPLITSAERVIFPVKCNAELVGWQMRSIPNTFYGSREDVVRYYHLFNKGNFLYNYDKAKKYQVVVVTEGVKKALKFPNGVATLGKGISSKQLDLIQEWDFITLLLDGDDKGQEAAEKVMRCIENGPKTIININLMDYGYESPDDATSEALGKIVSDAWMDQYPDSVIKSQKPDMT